MGFFDKKEQPGQMSQQDMQQAFMRDVDGLRRNVDPYIQRAGVDIPQNLMGNPRAMAMHLIQSGQADSVGLRIAQPLINRMMGRR